MNLNEGSTLNVRPGLIGDFHDELVLVLDALSEDVEVNGGSHVVNVGHEADLPALGDQIVQNAGIVNGLVKVAVAGRVITERLQNF